MSQGPGEALALGGAWPWEALVSWVVFHIILREIPDFPLRGLPMV